MTTRAVTNWRDLVDEVPRGPFMPEVVWVDGPSRTFVPVSRSAGPDRWRAATSGDQPVITQVDDGERGYPEAAPYDRIIATASARTVPFAWIEQTRRGGVVVTPWGTDYASALARLEVGAAGVAVGRFEPGYAFMRLRSQRRYLVNADGTELDLARAERSTADLSGADVYRIIAADEAAFAIGLQVPHCRMLYEEDRLGERHHVVELHDHDSGSWAFVDVDLDGRETGFDVFQHGPRRLWDEARAAYMWWLEHGSPAASRFGITVVAASQVVWLDDPGSDHTWTMA